MTVSKQLNDNKKFLYQQLYELLRQDIISGKYKYAEKLPSVRTLCSQYKVNLSTVTKSLELLERYQFINSIPGSGHYVIYNEKNEVVFEDFLPINVDKSYFDLASATFPHSLFPVEQFKNSLIKVIERDGASAFDYVDNLSSPLRGFLCDIYLRKFLINVLEDELIIVSGAQQGIEVAARSFLKSGDTILMEHPSYLGAYSVFKNMNLNVVSFDINNFDEIELIIRKHQPKALYLIPISHNPTGYSYTEEQKKYFIQLAEKYNFYIIEDDFLSDIYNFGNNDGIKPLKYYDKSNRVFYIKSFSKLTMPAIRIGFVVAPLDIADYVAYYKQSSDLSTSLFIQLAFKEFMINYFSQYIEKVKLYIDNTNKKFMSYLNILDKNILIKPNGIYCTLVGKNTSAFYYNQLKQKKILVAPHSTFFHKPNFINFFRISYLNIGEENLERIILEISNTLNK